MTPAELKSLIIAVAAQTPGVGPLQESLKWGEQSFTPAGRNIGSSVRIAPRPNGEVAVMFICHTHLVEHFRALYPDTFTFEGNRAILLQPGAKPDREALSHCIGLALTYKLRKRAKTEQI